MQTMSRDGIFTISASDTAKVGNSLDHREQDYDEQCEVSLTAEEATLSQLAEAIFLDCFDSDSSGLHLCAKLLICHVTIGKKNHLFKKDYLFIVPEQNCVEDVLACISQQLQL